MEITDAGHFVGMSSASPFLLSQADKPSWRLGHGSETSSSEGILHQELLKKGRGGRCWQELHR
jgi:hypothetical protein